MRRAKRKELEDIFAAQVLSYGLPEPLREARFHPLRKWQFDFAWPERGLAVEVEGGHWVRGRHVRPQGFARDTEKYNAAVALGWRVLRFTGDAVRNGTAIVATCEVMGDLPKRTA